MSSGDDYAFSKIVRERISPATGDPEYLVLSDLRSYLEPFRSDEPLQVLDYGAGYSPYRTLFPNAAYHRADYVASGEVDYLLPYDSAIPEKKNVFDLVISTQVAEHLPVPANYFAEALRVLKPGGSMIVTTHGCWPDHGVPYDFQRWTGDGLRRDLEHAGFKVERLSKLTTSDRCYLFLLIQWLSYFNTRRRNFSSRVFSRFVRTVIQVLRPVIHPIIDRLWPDSRIVDEPNLETHHFYSIIAAVARKAPTPL